MASEVLKIDLKASDSTGAAFASLQRSMTGVSKSFATVQSVVKGGLGLLVAGGIGEAIGSVRQYADAWTGMTNKLKSGGLDIAQAAVAQQKIIDIASSSRSTLAEVGNLYGRIAFATETLGTSQSDVSKMTETLSKAFKLSGKTALEAQSAVTQFTQALSSGVLQGDELRSLRENAPEIARAIADSFGVTVGALKELGAEGKLTADKIVPAILDASDKIDARFATTRKTFEDYGIAISNYFQTIIGGMQEFLQKSDEVIAANAIVNKQSQELGLAPVQQDNTMLDLVSKKTEDMFRAATIYNDTMKRLAHMIDSTEAPKTFLGLKLTGENLEKTTRLSDELVFAIRGVFEEFKKTNQASDDILVLAKNIKKLAEDAGLKPDDKLLVYLLELTKTAATADSVVTTLQRTINNLLGTTFGMSFTPKVSMPQQFNPSDIRSNNSPEALKQMDAFRRTYFLNNQYYIKTASETEKLALELIADAKKKDITLSTDQARLQAEGIIKQNDAAGAAKKYGDEIESLKEKYENVADPLKKFNDDLAEVEMLYKKGAIGADVYSNAVANINKAKQDFIDKSDPMKDQLKELERAFDGFGKKSADAIAEFVVSGKMDFRDLIQSMIKEMISMLVYQNLLKGMFSGMGGNPFAFLFSAMGAGAAGPGMPPSGRAVGGPVSANRPYIVGEKGPELFMSGSSGSIVPNNALGGGVSINIINNSNAQATTQESTDGRGNRKIDVVIGEVVAKQIGQIGSGVNNSLRSTFGSAPALVGR